MKCERVGQHMDEGFVEMVERGFERTDEGIRRAYVCPICKDVKYGEYELE